MTSPAFPLRFRSKTPSVFRLRFRGGHNGRGDGSSAAVFGTLDELERIATAALLDQFRKGDVRERAHSVYVISEREQTVLALTVGPTGSLIPLEF